jgi:TP901 family phage tail tape measure protein
VADKIEIIFTAKDDVTHTVGGIKGALGSLGGAMTTAGGAIVAGAAVGVGALVALGASSVGVATDFESSMAIMSTAVDPETLGVNSAAEAMNILGDAALAVGSDTALVGVSASSAAEAITGLYKAGLDTGEIFGDLQGYLAGTAELSGALRASVDLAAASELDMVQASELAAVTLATFGGELQTTEERAAFVEAAMNNFVQTADGSVASVQDLADALVNVGPTAAAFGFSLQETNTALGILSTRGISGAEAGTALKSMLNNLMKTTPEVTETLKDLGVELYNADGTMRGLPNIIGQLEESMAGMTEEQRNQTVAVLAGSYGMNAMNTLLGEGVEGWTEMSTSIANAATMQETAAARTNTFEGAIEALSGVLESLRISIGLPLIQQVLTPLARIFAELAMRHGPALEAVFEKFGAGISKIIDVVQSGQLKELFTIFEDGSSVLGSIFEAFGMGEEQANALATSISNVVTTLQNLITPVIEFVQSHGPQLKNVLLGIGVALGAFSIISTIVGWITGLIAAVSAAGAAISAAGGIVGAIVALLGGPLTIVIGIVAAAIGLLTVAWKNNWGDIQGKVRAAWAFIQPILAAVIEWVGVHVKAAIEALRAWWVDTAWPAIQKAVEVAWPIIQAIFSAIRDFIVNTLIPTVQRLWRVWTEEVWPVIQTVTENVWTVIKAIFEELGRWINANIVPWVKFLHAVWVNEVWPAIQRAVEAAWNIIEPIWNAIRQWAAETLPPVLNTLRGIFETVMSGISAAIAPVKAIWDAFVGAVQGFWNWISSHVFSFNISLPDLPDWATPGSPLPIHTAWKDFAADMGGIQAKLATGVNMAGGGYERGSPVSNRSMVINVDARGAAPGVEQNVRRAVEDVLRQYGIRADARIRTRV